jgi:DnaJ-class molecular chaperone
MNSGAGKGDKQRPTDLDRYTKNWVRVFGDTCKACNGTGRSCSMSQVFMDSSHVCSICNGIGKVDRK